MDEESSSEDTRYSKIYHDAQLAVGSEIQMHLIDWGVLARTSQESKYYPSMAQSSRSVQEKFLASYIEEISDHFEFVVFSPVLNADDEDRVRCIRVKTMKQMIFENELKRIFASKQEHDKIRQLLNQPKEEMSISVYAHVATRTL